MKIIREKIKKEKTVKTQKRIKQLRLRKEYKIILYERGNDDESNYVMDMSYKYMFFSFTSYDFFM